MTNGIEKPSVPADGNFIETMYDDKFHLIRACMICVCVCVCVSALSVPRVPGVFSLWPVLFLYTMANEFVISNYAERAIFFICTHTPCFVVTVCRHRMLAIWTKDSPPIITHSLSPSLCMRVSLSLCLSLPHTHTHRHITKQISNETPHAISVTERSMCSNSRSPFSMMSDTVMRCYMAVISCPYASHISALYMHGYVFAVCVCVCVLFGRS